MADWEEVGVTEKSCPTPESATVCGLPTALSVIARVPVLVPPTVGSKETLSEQLEPAARLLLQEESSELKSTGLVVMLVIVSCALPVFVISTVWGMPVVPTY